MKLLQTLTLMVAMATVTPAFAGDENLELRSHPNLCSPDIRGTTVTDPLTGKDKYLPFCGFLPVVESSCSPDFRGTTVTDPLTGKDKHLPFCGFWLNRAYDGLKLSEGISIATTPAFAGDEVVEEEQQEDVINEEAAQVPLLYDARFGTGGFSLSYSINGEVSDLWVENFDRDKNIERIRIVNKNTRERLDFYEGSQALVNSMRTNYRCKNRTCITDWGTITNHLEYPEREIPDDEIGVFSKEKVDTITESEYHTVKIFAMIYEPNNSPVLSQAFEIADSIWNDCIPYLQSSDEFRAVSGTCLEKVTTLISLDYGSVGEDKK